MHLASRWKGCSIRGKARVKGIGTSRNGANRRQSFVSFRERMHNGRAQGNSLTFAQIRSVELISSDARTSPARLPPAARQ